MDVMRRVLDDLYDQHILRSSTHTLSAHAPRRLLLCAVDPVKCFALRDPPKRISAIRSKAKRTKASAGGSDTATTSAKRQKQEKKKDKSRASKETSKKRPKAKMMSGAAIVSSELAS